MVSSRQIFACPRPLYEQLKELARRTVLATDDIPDEIVVKSGIPESAILEAAAELGIDLIVMASHGRTGLAHLGQCSRGSGAEGSSSGDGNQTNK